MKVDLWSPGMTEFGGGVGAFSLAMAEEFVVLGHAVRVGGLLDRAGPWNGLDVFGAGDAPVWARPAVFAAQCALQCIRLARRRSSAPTSIWGHWRSAPVPCSGLRRPWLLTGLTFTRACRARVSTRFGMLIG